MYAGLMRGQPFAFEGKHFSARPTDFMLPPPPVQQPHPVWVVGAYVPGRSGSPRWSARRGGRSAPQHRRPLPPGGAPPYTLESFADLVRQVRALREAAGLPWEGYDVVVEADSSGQFVQLEGTPGDWAQAGGTWWVESWWSLQPGPEGVAELRRRIEAGPPRD